jgi:NAD(P)H-flavin reductase/ferredoxin
MSVGARVNLKVNGSTIQATMNQTLINAGLMAGIVIPHDCSSGQCETCRVHVISGSIGAEGTADGDTVLACKAILLGDAEIAYEAIPTVVKRSGEVVSIKTLAGVIVEVRIRLNARLTYLPGQYVKVKFAGFPERPYSLSLPLDASADEDELTFHIRCFPGGLVSSALGRKIRPGGKAAIRGPYGHAYLRQATGRLILVAGGAGFAPIWSIALASRLSAPNRPISLVIGVGDVANLYMRPALQWLAAHGVSDIVLCADTGDAPGVRWGRPTAFLPAFRPDDMVYAAGAPEMVAAIKVLCREAGVTCYADPFFPGAQKVSLVQRLSLLLQSTTSQPAAIALGKKAS